MCIVTQKETTEIKTERNSLRFFSQPQNYAECCGVVLESKL